VLFFDANSGEMTYTINGVTQVKNITRYIYSAGAPTCKIGGTPGATPNYQDLWWERSGTESGWGVNLTHQGDIIFATLFTYRPDGRDLWLVGSLLARQPDGRFSGAIHRVTGPPFNAAPWTAIAATEVGTMALAFADGEHGTLAYSYEGVPVTKAITRYVFDDAVPVCR
jgi:hypothetical protein